MRVTYQTPVSNKFDIFFNHDYERNIKGAGLSDIRIFKPINYSRGGSFFNVVSNIIRNAIPFIKGLVFPEVGNFAKNVVNDLGNDIPFKKNIRKNLVGSMKNIGKRVIRGGGGRINKRKNKKHKCGKQNKHKAIEW